ncbi:beta-galactosidase [Pengzhenrongella phosphoraccumulans]|uniref:beta-galactosidase n=1 Tax=Pengzhenrongella phosphoraccumulans TaxID=3114394 RepID=UPI0038904A8B
MDQIRVADGQLWVGEKSMPLIAGEVQFWRMPRAHWRPALEAVVALGIPMISTYLSWRRHEPEEGQFHWGDRDPRLDARAFVELCADLGLLVQLKPGPWICAEEPGGGYPDWIMADPDILALGAGDQPVVGYNPPFLHPVPSHHHPRYTSAARGWLTEVWRELGDLRHPTGPIVAIQLDNEPSVCFQDALYFADYHPLAIEAFRAWLPARYDADVDRWRAAWGQAAATAYSFSDAQPPRPNNPSGATVLGVGTVARPTPANRRAIHDWTEFLGSSLVGHLETIRQIHQDLGCGHLLATVNIINHPIHDVPISHQGIRRGLGAQASAIGVDHYYEPPLTWEAVDRLAKTAATARAVGEPVVWAPELMTGIWRSPGEVVAYPDPTPVEQEAWWGAAVALGYQGFNLYMLVNRENWEHGPLSSDGAETTFAGPVRQVTTVLALHPALLMARLAPKVSVIWHRPDAIDAYCATGTMRQPNVPWGNNELPRAYNAWSKVVQDLVIGGFPYDLWDPTALVDAPGNPANMPTPGTIVVVPEPSTVSEATLTKARGAGFAVVRVPAEKSATAVLSAHGLRPSVAITDAGQPAQRVLATLHATGSERFIHLVSWGEARTVTLELGPPTDTRPPLGPDPSPRGLLTDLTTGTLHTITATGTCRLELSPGHQILAWEQR